MRKKKKKLYDKSEKYLGKPKELASEPHHTMLCMLESPDWKSASGVGF